jgi:hypothetical protein
VKNPKNTWSFFVLLLITTFMTGCANRMATNVPSEYRDSVAEVESIGLVHIPAHPEHPFRTNVNTYSGPT